MSPSQRDSERMRQQMRQEAIRELSRRETSDDFPVCDEPDASTSGYRSDKGRLFYWLLGVLVTIGALVAGWMMGKVLDHGDRLTRIEVMLEHISSAVGARP